MNTTSQTNQKEMPNTPFPDIVVLLSDSPKEMHHKIGFYVAQGYVITAQPRIFEDLKVDAEAIGRPNIEMARASGALAILMRRD